MIKRNVRHAYQKIRVGDNVYWKLWDGRLGKGIVLAKEAAGALRLTTADHAVNPAILYAGDVVGIERNGIWIAVAPI